MIFSEDLLFIHVPKTGGSSITAYLCDVLPKPIYLSQPFCEEELTDLGILQIPGIRHETLAEARDVVAAYGFDLDRFPLILATIRNPYDLDVSRYAYLREGHEWERGAEQDLALTSGFEAFAVRNPHRGGHWTTDGPNGVSPFEFARHGRQRRGYPNDLAAFFAIDGHCPRNLRILRFEHLAEDLVAALRGIGIDAGGEFPWINRSDHDHYLSYYTPSAEESVYRRYRWAFDHGFYQRLDHHLLLSPTGD